MMNKRTTFDEIFLSWMNTEINQLEKRDWLPVAKQKGFDSVIEWRLQTALRLGMNKKEWIWETITNPNQVLPQIMIGPFQGWLNPNDLKFGITFKEALENPNFFEWCQNHDRIPDIAQNFPQPSIIILFRLPTGQLIHIEGGHRICAVAYAQKIGQPIQFQNNAITAGTAEIMPKELDSLKEFLTKGTFKT